MGYSGQAVGWLEAMTLETSASERRKKEGSMHVSGVWVCLRGGGAKNLLLMVDVLLTKKVAKSSVVKLDKGWGGGMVQLDKEGQRRF